MKKHSHATSKKVSTKITWNLGLLYTSDKDPRIESDIKNLESRYSLFAKKYSKNMAKITATPVALAKALKDYEQLAAFGENAKPYLYFAFRSDIDAGDTVARARMTQIGERMTKAQNQIEFFTLAVGVIPARVQKSFLKHVALKPYSYMLKRLFLSAKHTLSEKEEQLTSLLADSGMGMWVDAQERLLSSQTVDFAGAKMPISEAQAKLSDLPRVERHALAQAINVKLKEISYFAEAEINAVYNFKKVMDEKRGFVHPFDATILSYENDPTVVDNLVKTVTKYFSVSKRFYKLHATLLKKQALEKGESHDITLTYADRSAHIGEITKKYDFDDAVDLVKKSFSRVGSQYAKYLDDYLAQGQIDVYPKKGKRGGAYCAGSGLLPTFVLLNHTDTLRSVETIAHEMGHAIHTELSKGQPPLYRGYSTAAAEVASTFFEQVVMDAVLETATDAEKIILLHNRLLGDISTIFRQIACYNYELDLHTRIRAHGQIDAATMANTMSTHMRAYIGPALTITEEDGYFFVSWSHIRNFFYVYSYAYGQLVSRALYEAWKKDHSFITKIEAFLCAGSSASPDDIFKAAGIDVKDPKFFEQGIKAIEKDIIALEKLTK